MVKWIIIFLQFFIFYDILTKIISRNFQKTWSRCWNSSRRDWWQCEMVSVKEWFGPTMLPQARIKEEKKWSIAFNKCNRSWRFWDIGVFRFKESWKKVTARMSSCFWICKNMKFLARITYKDIVNNYPCVREKELAKADSFFIDNYVWRGEIWK